jgi:hypothetical protein
MSFRIGTAATFLATLSTLEASPTQRVPPYTPQGKEKNTYIYT